MARRHLETLRRWETLQNAINVVVLILLAAAAVALVLVQPDFHLSWTEQI